MKDQVLSIERMQHLKELGVETSKASMYFSYHWDRLNIVTEHGNLKAWEERGLGIGAFTLQDMLEMMPQNIDGHTLLVSKNATAYQNVGWSTMKVFCNEGILINTYNMLCWLIENKLLGKEEK